MNDRDMYYGYGGFTPMGMPIGNGMNMNQGNNTIPNNYSNNIQKDMNDRIERLERQVKRLEQRLVRLETPYANNNYNNEPDNNMYMM